MDFGPPNSGAEVVKRIDLNLPRVVCQHLLDDRHSTHHHMVCGTGVMAVGVLVAKSAYLLPDFTIIHVTVDMVGYFIHGLGAVPFIEHIIAGSKEAKRE